MSLEDRIDELSDTAAEGNESIMKRGFWILTTLGVFALLLWTCAFQLAENEFAIVSRFGDPRREINEAGLHFKLPVPIDTLRRVDGRVHVLDPAPDEYLTGDKKNVIVDSFMAWQVADPLEYYRSVTDRFGAEARLTDVLRSVVGDVLSSYKFIDLVSQGEREIDMSDINDAISREASSKAAQNFGIRVAAVRIKRLNFPMQNKSAVFQRMESEREGSAGVFRAEGLEQYEKIKAEADRKEAELISEAQRKARELRGEAEAQATRIYAEAIAADPELYEFLQSLEIIERVLDEEDTVVLPSDHQLLRVLEGSQPVSPKANGAQGD
ncbi:MAG: membrane protease subunit HflC [Planctomycetota bacterium]|jgi:membrane protease subunit HflC